MVIHGIFLRSVQIKQNRNDTDAQWNVFNWIVKQGFSPDINGEILRIFHGPTFPLSQTPWAHLGTGWNIIAMFQKQRFFFGANKKPICHKNNGGWKNMFFISKPFQTMNFGGGQKSCSSCLRAPNWRATSFITKKKENNRPAKVRPKLWWDPWRLQMSKGRLRIPSCHLKPRALLHSELRTESRVLNGRGGTCRTESRGGRTSCNMITTGC